MALFMYVVHKLIYSFLLQIIFSERSYQSCSYEAANGEVTAGPKNTELLRVNRWEQLPYLNTIFVQKALVTQFTAVNGVLLLPDFSERLSQNLIVDTFCIPTFQLVQLVL